MFCAFCVYLSRLNSSATFQQNERGKSPMCDANENKRKREERKNDALEGYVFVTMTQTRARSYVYTLSLSPSLGFCACYKVKNNRKIFCLLVFLLFFFIEKCENDYFSTMVSSS